MDDNIVDLCAQQPHVTIQTHDGNVSVVPVAALRGIASGQLPASNLGEPVLRAIISDYLDQIQCHN